MKYYIHQVKKETTLLDFFKSLKVAKNKINYLIDNNFCYLDGNILKRDSILKYNDYLMIDLSNYQSDIKYKSCKTNLDILYEDKYMIVVNKPARYIIHQDEGEIHKPTLTDMVISHLRLKEDDAVAYAAHRLDKDTTGIVVFAKDIITLAYLSNLFESKQIVKVYNAIVEGKTNVDGTINYSIGTDRHVNNKMVITKNGKPAFTRYETIKLLHGKSLLKVFITTGKTHQIRVHLAAIKHPIVGDEKYGATIPANRALLHCAEITFAHPNYNKDIVIKCKLPSDMYKFVK